MLGLLTGGIRFILEFSYPLPECGEPDMRPPIIKDFHYLYFAVFLFLLVLITAVIISHFTQSIDEEHVSSHISYFPDWFAHCEFPLSPQKRLHKYLVADIILIEVPYGVPICLYYSVNNDYINYIYNPPLCLSSSCTD